MTATSNGNGRITSVDALPYIRVDRQAYYRAERERELERDDRAGDDVQPIRGLRAGRHSIPSFESSLGQFGMKSLPRRQYFNTDIRRLDFTKMTPYQVMDILAEVSPEVSQALWNQLLLTNSGLELKAMTPDGKEQYPEAQIVLDELVAKVNARHGGLNAVINQLHYTAYLQGAMCCELALSRDLTDIEDLYPIAPWTIEFEYDKSTKQVTPVQHVPNVKEKVTFDELTFWYLPLLPNVDDPYGRIPFASVLYPLHFDLQMLFDLHVALHANAWDKMDITIDEAAVLEMLPRGDQRNALQRKQFVEKFIAEMEQSVSDMHPDDHWVHTQAVTVNPITGGSRSMQVVPIFRHLERRIIRALHQLPVLMGSNEGTTETHGTVQFDIYVAGVKAVQHLSESILEEAFTLALQVRGIKAQVDAIWEDVRTTDRMKDAQAEATEIANAITKRDQGWISQEEAAYEITGSEPVEDEPGAEDDPAEPEVDIEDDDPDDEFPFALSDPAGSTRSSAAALEQRERHIRMIEALAGRYFREQADAFPVDEVAAQVEEAFGGRSVRDEDDDVTAEDVIPFIAVWFAGRAAAAITRDFVNDLTAQLVAAGNSAGQYALRQLGIKGTFNLTNPVVINDLNAQASAAVQGVNQHSQQRLASEVSKAVNRGGKVPAIRGALIDAFDSFARDRAGAIGADMGVGGYHAVQQEAHQRNAIYRHRWFTMRDELVCEVCRPNHNAHRVIGRQEFPSGHRHPPAHPYCRCDIEPVIPDDYEAPEDPWTGE